MIEYIGIIKTKEQAVMLLIMTRYLVVKVNIKIFVSELTVTILGLILYIFQLKKLFRLVHIYKLFIYNQITFYPHITKDP